jgi:signal transduction histidine kinase
VFYVLIQFGWWAFLLIDLNDEVYQHKIENVELRALKENLRTDEIYHLEKKIEQRRWMVIGEGSVFLALLIWGAFMMIKAYKKEMLLARLQKNFLLSITHEFKSPVASIKLYLQTLLKHDLDKKKEISFINSAISDTDRLNNLVENALMANLIDHEGYSFGKEDLNFSALLRLLSQKFQQMPEHSNLNSKIEDGLYIYADKNAMTIMVNNLLENAWKYSKENKQIGLTAKSQEDHVILEISDQGIGITDKEKLMVFEKFYRIGNEETRRTKGTGLGLFICKYIVDKHEGKISIQDNDPQGTIFRIEFPVSHSNL